MPSVVGREGPGSCFTATGLPSIALVLHVVLSGVDETTLVESAGEGSLALCKKSVDISPRGLLLMHISEQVM